MSLLRGTTWKYHTKKGGTFALSIDGIVYRNTGLGAERYVSYRQIGLGHAGFMKETNFHKYIGQGLIERLDPLELLAFGELDEVPFPSVGIHADSG